MNDYSVTAVRRAVRVLDALASKPDQTLQEIAEKAELSKPTTFRLLYTLTQDNLAFQDSETKRYRLGARIISLGQSAKEATNIIEVARPIMEELFAKFHIVITLNLPSQNAVFEVLRVPQSGRGEFIPVGTPLPYHACASGIVFLAYSEQSLLQRIMSSGLEQLASQTPKTEADVKHQISQMKKQGYARMKDALEEGVTALASPIFDYRGTVAGTLGSAAPSGALPARKWTEFGKALSAAAADVSEKMGSGQSWR